MLEVTSVTSYFPSRSAGETIHRSPKGQEERHASLSQSRAERRAGREAAARGCWGAGEEGERERAWNWAAVPSEIMGACWKRKMQIHIPAEPTSQLNMSASLHSASVFSSVKWGEDPSFSREGHCRRSC